ncbi:hypothetical protein AAFC00_006841 [Neodothiora populina]|uniref:Glutamine amidotransferase domain-containing protein n=1 Tax=Neodothiora populina TaxID=2781224 RepID=A0ABR3PBA8_9PEZI
MTIPTPTNRPLRIAVLECDRAPAKAHVKYGGYGGLYERLLVSGAEALAREHSGAHDKDGGDKGMTVVPRLEVSKYDVKHEGVYPAALEDVDAVLLSGSKFNAYDNDSWILKLVAYVQSILAQTRVRLIGVCFGHQIIGRALGAAVSSGEGGWETSVTHMSLTPKGQEVFGCGKTLTIHQMHKDIVRSVPPGIELLASTAICQNQSMYSPGRLMTIQGHPEFNAEVMTEILETRHASGVFDDGMFEEAMSRVARKQHGVDVVGKAFVRFALEG